MSSTGYISPEQRLIRKWAAESRARSAACRRDHFDTWRVLDRECNYSAFNGYARTPSAYSMLRCGTCGRVWRTNAGYVPQVPDAEPVMSQREYEIN